MPVPTHADRIARLEAVARIYAPISGEDRTDIATDLLADLLHWCARHAVDAEAALLRARMHAAAETDEAARRR